MNAQRINAWLAIAGVPGGLHPQALACMAQADDRSQGLLWAKLKTRILRAGKIAKAMQWRHNRLIDVRPDWADDDIAPMLNVTGQGDNGPWVFPPGGGIADGRPVQDYWLNPDPESEEYKGAVKSCYWCLGQHPRSEAARKAWYRRNGGEYRAWRLGCAIDNRNPVERWAGEAGSVRVSVVRCGAAWVINVTRRVLWRLALETRIGFEVDNVFCGQYAPQMWYPIPGYDLRAPVTWSTVPTLKGAA